MVSTAARYFTLPVLAAVVIGSLPVSADAGRSSNVASCYGSAMSSVTDPVLRASFKDFERTQSVAAAKICAIYANSVEASQ